MTTGRGSLRPRPVSDPDVRVVVIHHAGGSRSRAIVDLVAHLVDELSPWTDRPLALFGHSVGALVTYELARPLGACRGRCGSACRRTVGRRRAQRTGRGSTGCRRCIAKCHPNRCRD